MKRYSSVSAEDLDDLRKRLIESRHKFVHLIATDPWEDVWSYHKSDIPTGELSEADISWLQERQESTYASRRYLVCRL
jgi:hypothetical protein